MTIGDILRTAREAKGWTLRDVEAGTYIKEEYLKAIEERDYERIPGQVYLKGFVRNYAAYVGLDSIDLLKQLKLEIGESSDTLKMNLQTTPVTARTPSKTDIEKYRYKEGEEKKKSKRGPNTRSRSGPRRARTGKRSLEWSEILIIAIGIIVLLSLGLWLLY